jgi:hypothetical protein
MIHDAALAEEFTIPDGLRIETALLVIRFASALSVKLRAAEIKHDHAVGWADEGWEEECRRQLEVHVEKGDPRDVAIYYAFMWHHHWDTCRKKGMDESTSYP